MQRHVQLVCYVSTIITMVEGKKENINISMCSLVKNKTKVTHALMLKALLDT